MAASSGIAAIVNYAAITGNKATIQALIDLIPDPDSASTSGATAGGGFLDEMSPAAAVQLRVELVALKAAVEDV